MNLNPPPKVRAALYIITGIGTPFVMYLFAKHWIGQLEVALWGSEVTVISLMAGFNVTSK